MKKKTWSKVLVAFLCLTMSVWALAGCGGSGDGEDANDDGDTKVLQASEITSDLFMADDVQAFYDNLDVEYGYDLMYELSYNWDDLAEACGYRTAGSDSEHACADYLAAEMEKIGLQNVDKVGTECDKFQFNSSSLKIDGSKVDFKGGDQKAVEAGTNGPASYQVNGTDGDLKAKIVDVNNGFAWEYDEAGFKEGDIALVHVDQSAEAWIDTIMTQAAEYGASAVISWADSGYGTIGTYTTNVQDVCCSDLLPTCAISADQAKMVKKAIKNGHDQATLNIDAVMEEGGTTYNVCGMIPGKSHEQKIIISGHYDKYWYGFQDDNSAMGLVFAVAKAMIDAGYEPENDIYFVCHGAEEWGVTDSMFDWTTGAWGMCNEQNFADDVIAMLNFELCAHDMSQEWLFTTVVPEFDSLNAYMLKDSGLVITEGDQGIAYRTTDATSMEDGVTYREFGTPYFLNGFEGEDFQCSTYHTKADNEDTYNEDVFKTNMNWCGAYAIYIDQMPALELDMTGTADRLEKANVVDYTTEAGIDAKDYDAAIQGLKDAAAKHNKAVAKCNEKYAKAVADGDEEAMAKLRAEGIELNQPALEAFQVAQDEFLKASDFGAVYGHGFENANVEAFDVVLDALEAGEGPVWGEDGDGPGDYLCNVNAVIEYYYCNYSLAVGDDAILKHSQKYYKDADQAQWGWNHLSEPTATGKYSAQIFAVEDISDLSKDQIKELKAGYEDARAQQIEQLGACAQNEIDQMGTIADILK